MPTDGLAAETPSIFAITLPGLEQNLAEEASQAGFRPGAVTPGGVEIAGGWADLWRANLELRCATRILWRMGSFMAFHPAQLDKRARKFDWGTVLDPATPVRVEVATNRRSKIYHAGAATSRIAGGLEAAGFTVADDGAVTLKVRIDDNRVTISVDTSGEPLHKRGTKQAVGKAPLRETLAAAFLRQCGFDGSQTVLDPMCGSGTFLLEAAEIATGSQAGRMRSFAFERLQGFDADTVADLRTTARRRDTTARFIGSDRDQGVVGMATQNAERAGLSDLVTIAQGDMGQVQRPDGAPGLVMINPPYGARIGNKKALFGLYGRLGQVLTERFGGWRLGMVTSEPGLAKATGLNLQDGPPIAHGGLRVKLYQADIPAV